MLKMTTFCLSTCTQPCSPLVNGFIDDVLRDACPSVNKVAALSRFCHGLVSCTHAPASVHRFGSQLDSGPDSLIATDLAR